MSHSHPSPTPTHPVSSIYYMNNRFTLFGLNLSQFLSLLSFLVIIISIWVHMEIRLAEINVELTNLKQDIQFHKADNRKDIDLIRSAIKADTKEILKKIDEIQIYLRNNR